MLGSYIFPESTSLFNSLLNYAGKIKITSSSQKGVISQVILQVPQVLFFFLTSISFHFSLIDPSILQMFHKMKSSKLAEMNNIKFNYFKEKVFFILFFFFLWPIFNLTFFFQMNRFFQILKILYYQKEHVYFSHLTLNSLE